MKKIFLYTLLAFILSLNAQTVFAQNNYTLLEPLPCIQGTQNGCLPGETIERINLNTFIEYVFKFSIALAVFLAVIMIIWGGFEYMVSEVPFVKVNAKSRIFNAIMGLLGAFLSYLILLTIDPRLVQINTEIEPLNIDIAEVIRLRNSIERDLKELDVESRAKVIASQAKLNSFETQRKQLAKECEDGVKDGEEQCNRPIAVLDKSIREERATLNKTVTEQIGISQFGKALNIVTDDRNYSQGTLALDGKQEVDKAKISIAAKYNEYIAEIVKDDPAMAQALNKQGSFYISQVDEETELAKSLILRKNIGIPSGPGYVQLKKALDENTKALTPKLNTYKDNIQKAAEKSAASGLSQDTYIKIMQSRVEKIETAFKAIP